MKEFKDYLDRKMERKKDLLNAMNEAHKNSKMKKIGNLHLVSLVCKELREKHEYDFDSEFWDDEMNAMLFEIIEVTRKVLEAYKQTILTNE